MLLVYWGGAWIIFEAKKSIIYFEDSYEQTIKKTVAFVVVVVSVNG